MYYLLKNQILHKLASEQQIKSHNSCDVISCVLKLKLNYKNVQIYYCCNENYYLPSLSLGSCHTLYPAISNVNDDVTNKKCWKHLIQDGSSYVNVLWRDISKTLNWKRHSISYFYTSLSSNYKIESTFQLPNRIK